ncbi:hypothetical protein [Saccharothrix sp. Mg75]|uniref:hypothetical protein n=1 Tax=Saccharothrix sp. Mg75 TaxID=3445357 RepID=UPI003EEAA607
MTDPARAVWREALELYRDQGRDTDADHVQQQLDDLDNTTNRNPDAAADRSQAGIQAGNDQR